MRLTFLARFVVCLSVVALAALLARAADETPAEKPDPAPAAETLSLKEIEALIRQLDDADFEVREAATKKLTAAGKVAIEPVAQAADTDNLEIATRAIGVLKELAGSPAEATRAAAVSALKQLSQSKTASVARRAAAALAPSRREFDARRGLIPRGVNVQVVRGGRVQVQVSNVNGQTEVNVDEDDKKIRITHEGGKDIVVEVTEPPDEGAKGKGPKTTQFKAADADELKKKHPEAHRLFEKYGSGGGGAFNVIVGNAGAFPAG